MRAGALLLLLLAILPAARAAEPPRIVTLGGAVTEIVFALGHGAQVVGVDSSSVFPPEAAALPQTGYVRTLSAEGILSLRPQLILATEEAGPPNVIAQIDAAGVRVERIAGGYTLDAVRQKIARVAAALGISGGGGALLASLDEAEARLRGLAFASRPKVLFVMNRGEGTLLASGTGTAADAMIQLAGGTNAVRQYAGYKPLSPEAAVAAAPDLILTTTRSAGAAGGADALLNSPALALTPAAKRRRVVAMDDLYLLGFGARTGAAALELAEKIHAP